MAASSHQRTHAFHGLAQLGLAAGLLLALSASVFAQDDPDCFVCHGDPDLHATLPDGRTLSLYVDEELYTTSAHTGVGCIACHADITELPHPPQLAPVDCGVCHVETEVYETSVHGQALHEGDTDAARCQDCHSKHEIRPSDHPLSWTHPANLPATCGVCHSDPELSKKHMIGRRDPSAGYLHSQHGRAIQEGRNMDAATCNDCHGSHDIQPSHLPASRVFSLNIPATCGQCHPAEVEEFRQSIHGKALAAGIKDAPNCTSCHGEHEIIGPAEKESLVSLHAVAQRTCPQCHDDVSIMEKYGVPAFRQASYMDSYHGLAGAAGSEVVATCTSCHGVHHILPESDPASSIHPDNLVATCAQCHANATPNFAVGKVHIMPTDPGQRALGIVRIVYLWLIALVLGGMTLHNTLLMFRHSLTKLFLEMKPEGTFRRFTRGEVIGHFLIFVSFTALAISGFALRYPESWFTQLFFFGDAGLAFRGIVHRMAAVMFVALTVTNVVYITLTRRGRRELKALWMGFGDIADFFRNVAYCVGLRSEPPKFGRYSYKEKFEYWGLWWGSVIMIITGFCMWFANWFLSHWPKIALDIMAYIHFYEAWLAVGAIIIWHLYYMVFDPETYPMNWSWITGRITEQDFKERHPLEYEKVVGKAADEEPSLEAARAQSEQPAK